MKAQELREKSEAELKEELMELTQEQFKLRVQKSTGQLAKPHVLRVVRRSIARVKTLLTEKKQKSEA